MKTFFPILLAIFPFTLWAQQLPDSSFHPDLADPRYPARKGPVVLIDEAHHNFHTLDGRYRAFANVLEADGYRLGANPAPFSAEGLQKGQILVIANPLNASNDGGNWQLPTPSAFTEEEIAAVRQWVEAGGRLFLIADHMPFAGAAQDLARVFGFEYSNCFAMDNRRRQLEYFHRANGLLQDHPASQGLDSIITFTGSAFRIPPDAQPILRLDGTYTLLEPAIAWQFHENTPFLTAEGYYQGATREVGKGRVIVWGEAAMFSSQLSGPQRTRFGMSIPEAKANVQLLINLVRWLDRGRI